MIRFRVYCLLLIVSVLMFSALAGAETQTDIQLSEKEWTWEKNSIATFGGTVSLEGMPEGKVLLCLSFSTEPKGTDPGEIVFHTVNGKKLTLRKQKSEYLFDPKEQETLEFIGNWRTPDDVFYTKVEIDFRICSEDGNTVLAQQKLTVSRDASELADLDDGKIRLKIDFSAWILRIGIAAAVIWILAVVRLALNRNRKKKEK